MKTPKSKEVKIFCDMETETALVRIFKYRNYVWAGGRTLELKRGSRKLDGVFDFIRAHSETIIEGDLWKETDSAIGYPLNLEINNEKKIQVS